MFFAVRDHLCTAILHFDSRMANVGPNAVSIAVFVKLNFHECMLIHEIPLRGVGVRFCLRGGLKIHREFSGLFLAESKRNQLCTVYFIGTWNLITRPGLRIRLPRGLRGITSTLASGLGTNTRPGPYVPILTSTLSRFGLLMGPR
jgi:hypothetical protein